MHLSCFEAKMVGVLEENPALTLMRIGEWRQRTYNVTLISGAVVGLAEVLFIIFSSLVVVVYTLAGGAVGPDLKRIIRIKDFFFASFAISIFVARYLLISKGQWRTFDGHFWHLLGNAKLLEFLLLNKKATTYWGKIFTQLKNNTLLCKSNWGPHGNDNSINNKHSTSNKNIINNSIENKDNNNQIREEGNEGRREAWTEKQSRF